MSQNQSLSEPIYRPSPRQRCYTSMGERCLRFYDRLLHRLSSRFLPGRGREYQVRIPDLAQPFSIRLGSSDWSVMETIFYDGEYEPAVNPPLPGVRSVLDLGANAGFSIRLWQHHYPDARIVAVEPDSENARMCSLNVLPGAAEGQVVIVQACVGASARPVYLDRSGLECNFRMRDAVDPSCPHVNAMTVPEIVQYSNLALPIDLLKCDIEGAEAELFGDCGHWITQVRHLVVEVHDPYSPESFLEHLRSAGARLEVFHRRRTGHEELMFLRSAP